MLKAYKDKGHFYYRLHIKIKKIKSTICVNKSCLPHNVYNDHTDFFIEAK